MISKLSPCTLFRFPGQLNADMRKLAVNMVPFPRWNKDCWGCGYIPECCVNCIELRKLIGLLEMRELHWYYYIKDPEWLLWHRAYVALGWVKKSWWRCGPGVAHGNVKTLRRKSTRWRPCQGATESTKSRQINKCHIKVQIQIQFQFSIFYWSKQTQNE